LKKNRHIVAATKD